jgi:O-antigen ligase
VGVPEETTIVPVLVLLGGLTTGLLAQGGFYGAARTPLFVAVAVAFLLALVSTVPDRADLRLVPATAAAALAGWALLRGLSTDDPRSGVPMAALLASVVAVLLVVRRQGQGGRDLLLTGLLGAGVLVSAMGWVGVVWHRIPWALPNDGVWRATSTLTYANATAAVLVPLFLVSLGLLVGRPPDPRRSVVTAVLLIGALATLSRAGMLALIAGLLVLSALGGPRRLVVAGLAPATGAGVAVGGLLVAMPLGSAPHQTLPIVALPAGLMVAAALARWRPSPRGMLLMGTVLAIGVLPLARTGAFHRAMADVAETRASAGSSPRFDATEAAVRIARQHPLIGVGPDDGWVRWSSEGGATQTMQYVHDEYLQVLVELGLVGLTLLLAVLVGSGLLIRRAIHCYRATTLPAAVAAATAAAAVHGGFDFVWHLPVVPLVLAVLLGLLTEPAAQTLAGPTGPATQRRGDLS